MTAVASLHYGRVRAPGEDFDAESETDAMLLEHAGKAKRRATGGGNGYLTRRMLAEEIAPKAQEGDTALPAKRQYRRRDQKVDK